MIDSWGLCSVCHNVHFRSAKAYHLSCGILSGGATISATARRYRPQQKNHIGHTENQHRPQPYKPKPYRPQNIRRVYLASSCRCFSVSCSPYLTWIWTWNRALDDRPERSYTSPLLWRRQMSGFFKTKPANILLSITSSLTSFHSFTAASLLLKEYFALSSLTPFYATLIDRFLKYKKKYYRRRCRSIRSPLSLLVSSVVNPNYFNVVSHFNSKNPCFGCPF